MDISSIASTIDDMNLQMEQLQDEIQQQIQIQMDRVNKIETAQNDPFSASSIQPY